MSLMMWNGLQWRGRKPKPIDESDENAGLYILDDGASHHYLIDNPQWIITAHHTDIDAGPAKVLHDYKIGETKKTCKGNLVMYTLYNGGITRHYTHEELNELLLKHFRSIFKKDLAWQPWLLTNLHDDYTHDRRFYKFCKDLESICSCKRYAFLFIDYSYEKHLKRLDFDVKMLYDALLVTSDESENPRNRVLLYFGEWGIIYNIRFIETYNASKLEVSDAIKKGQMDTKIFSALHYDTLKKHALSFNSLVATPGVTTEQLYKYNLCDYCNKNLIISGSDLGSTGNISYKLDGLINRRERSRYRQNEIPWPISIKDAFEDLASQIWGSLSISDSNLPRLCDRAYDTFSRVYLNRSQRRFLRNPKKHILLKGGYGTGKSLLIQCKFKEAIQNAGTDDYFYYLSYTHDSLYNEFIKSSMRHHFYHHLRAEQVNVLTVTEYCKKFGFLRPLMVSDILEDVKTRHSNSTPHLFIDEFDGSNLTRTEGESIRRNLDELSESYVFIAMQSMEIVRRWIPRDAKGTETDYSGGHEHESTGMRIEVLDSIMRNCTRINDLTRMTVRTLMKHKHISYERELRTDEPVSSTTAITAKVKTKKNPVFMTGCMGGRSELQEPIRKDQTPLNSTSCDEIRVSDFECANLNFDYVIKQMNDNNSARKTGNKIESRFNFPGKLSNGVDMEGEIPVVVYPFGDIVVNYNNLNDVAMKERMRYAFSQVINIRHSNPMGVAVICFDLLDAEIFKQVITAIQIRVMEYLPALKPTANTRSTADIKKLMYTHVLITDHIGVRGLECKSVIVSVDPNESYLCHNIVEAFTRCLGLLSFTVIHKTDRVNKEDELTFGSIIKQWERKGLVEKHVVDICYDHSEEDTDLRGTCDVNDHTHKIHLWHSMFQHKVAVGDLEEVHVDVDNDMEASMRKIELSTNTQEFDEMLTKRRNMESHLKRIEGREFSHLEGLLREGNVEKFNKDFSALMQLKPTEILNSRDKENGNTLLHIAAMYNINPKLMTRMLRGGISVDITNEAKITPIIVAVENSSKEAVEYLVGENANLLAKGRVGEDIREVAKTVGNDEIIAFLEELLKEDSEEEEEEEPEVGDGDEPAECNEDPISKPCVEDSKSKLSDLPDDDMMKRRCEMMKRYEGYYERFRLECGAGPSSRDTEEERKMENEKNK